MLANVGYIIIFLLLWVIGKKFNLNFAWELKVVVIFANPNLQKKVKQKKREHRRLFVIWQKCKSIKIRHQFYFVCVPE